MGFWIFMLVMELLMPAFMIIYSNIYHDKAPKDINGSNGYKTAMSRLNRDTWEFANHYYNKRMHAAGWILLPLSAAAMLLVLGKGTNTIGMFGLIPIGVQIVVLLAFIAPTEIALRKNFDGNGNRK